MTSPARFTLASVASLALLAACSGSDNEAGQSAEDDPAASGALEDQIMVDPELSGQNQGGAGVSAGSNRVELPPEQRSPEAIAAARNEAQQKAGGSLRTAPSPASGGTASLVESAATAAQVAQATRSSQVDCTQRVEYSMNWASRLPEPLSVYPRGSVQEAAGTNSNGCALSVVSFVSPVTPDDVLNYYYTRLRKAGYSAEHRTEGGDRVLGGEKGSQAYVIYARELDNGLTEVDLVSSGK
ncbi:hypothetical protein GCM10011371_10630 [Novosphingobium marinum]|uniref:Lipoprotein n=1 Tax=Novosphingobium marinum TaxID=1514948 RepID=A0A7Y9XVA2_9SPHN|nr:hypothetical protein [Novosphingobium marinum]NYH95172.1 hypothetical protein [Novosphingobium marinum]GGC24899.1 hypothetical protein GCM10011371_10630 [Novosphingobium marinum]